MKIRKEERQEKDGEDRDTAKQRHLLPKDSSACVWRCPSLSFPFPFLVF